MKKASISMPHPLSIHRMQNLFAGLALAIVALLVTLPVKAAEATLEIAFGKQVQRFSRNELLARPELRSIDVPGDSAYKRPMRYKALPLSALVPPLAQIGTVQFAALDGFVANIPGALLAGPGQPWIAIEPPDAPWPALKAGGASAGPFYLVWLAAEKNGITPEQWPYQVAKIAEAAPYETRYPQIVPKPTLPADSAEQRGLKTYITSCSVCHQINGAGDASIGPDLNKPYSPVDYFQEPYLRKLIRDSASVRNWGQRVMPPFAPAALSDAALDDLLAYLRQMAKQR